MNLNKSTTSSAGEETSRPCIRCGYVESQEDKAAHALYKELNNTLKKPMSSETFTQHYAMGEKVRAPIASIMGLASLFDKVNSVEEVRELQLYLKMAVKSLDDVLMDSLDPEL